MQKITIKKVLNKKNHFFDLLYKKLFGIFPIYRQLERNGVLRYHKESKTYIRKIEGNKFHLNPRDIGISAVLAMRGIREEESVEALYKYINPDMKILDIGANIGFYVVLEAKIVSKGNGHIWAVEPVPDNVRLLELNVNTNFYTDVVNTFSAAICDFTGITKMQISPLSNCHRLLGISQTDNSDDIIEVSAYTVMDFATHAGIDINEVDFIRMDVEGAEYDIIPNILEFLETKESLLMFIEFHPHVNLEKHVKVISQLESCGFKCLSATKEYMHNGKIFRQHVPDATIRDLYKEELFLRYGGSEAFLQK